jgi:hypothetical protein
MSYDQTKQSFRENLDSIGEPLWIEMGWKLRQEHSRDTKEG